MAAGSGNKYQAEIDYRAAGEPGLEFRRYYNSALPTNSPVGMRWRSTYDREILTLNTNGGAPSVMFAAYRTGLVFTYWGGAWRSSDDINDVLTQLLDGSGNPIGWQYYVSASEDTETYDLSGRLLAIQTRSGLTTTLTYSTASTPTSIAPRAGLLIQVTDPFARQLSFIWSAHERIATMSDPDSKTYRYAYDSSARLTSVTYPGGGVRTYWYEYSTCKFALTGITDENGNRYSTYGYNSQCKATSTQLAGGAGWVSFSYGTNSTVVTDALGTARTLNFQVINGVTRNTGMTQPCAACSGVPSSSVTHDANGNVTARVDFNGNRTNYTYDLARNLETQRVEGLTSTASSTPSTRTITTDWNATFRLPYRIAEPKRVTTFTYDSNGNVTSKSIQATTDGNGAQGFSVTPMGSARTWTYTHTYHGSIPGLVAQTVADGPRTDVTDTTTYVWDGSGNLTSVTDALGHITYLSNYDAHGRPQQVTDPNGLVTALTYDLRGRLTSRTVGGEITDYDYDAAGQLTKVTLPDNSYLSYTYDAAHRLTQIQDNVGNRAVYTLDAMGNRTRAGL